MINLSFKAYPDIMENQIKQVMRENYASMEGDIVKDCTDKVNQDFRPVFNRQAAKLKNGIGQNDLKILLTTLKDAYNHAGMVNDSSVIEQQLKRLDVEA